MFNWTNRDDTLFFCIRVDPHWPGSDAAIHEPTFVALLSGAFLSEKVQPIVLAMAIVIHWYSNDCFSRSQERRIQCYSGPRSGFFAAIAYLYVRKLRTTEHALSIVFWFAAFSVAFTLIPAAPNLHRCYQNQS